MTEPTGQVTQLVEARGHVNGRGDTASAITQPGRHESGPTPSSPGGAHDPFPLTDLQAAYLVGASRLIELGGFHPSYYVELDVVGLDPARAGQAVRQLVRRHPHLRTVVLPEGGQRVLTDHELRARSRTGPAGPGEGRPGNGSGGDGPGGDASGCDGSEPTVHDLTGLDPARQEAAIRQTRQRMREAGPDPTGWPLYEIVINLLRPHRARVHIAMSLLLLDGRSIRLIQREWRELYDNPDAALPPLPRSFRDCRLELLAEEESERYRTHWAYWQARLDSLPDAPRLPLAQQRDETAPVRFRRRTFHLRQDEWKRVQVRFRQHRMLATSGLLHVFAEVIGAWADSPHFCLNVLHQNWATNHPESVGVVGQFGSTLPLEVDLGQGDDFWSRGERLQKQLWKDMAHGDVTAVRITRELARRRGWTTRAALPYVFTSMLRPGGSGAPGPQGADAGRPVCRTVTSDLRTPQVLVDNQLQDAEDGGVLCVWDVVDDAFPPGLAESMFEAYRQMLIALAAPDGESVTPDPVPAAHRALVATLNPAPAATPPDRLEDGFLRQAEARPEAVAVRTTGRCLTYAELEAESRAVAHWLRQVGVGRGDLVPVIMVKGWEQVVATLGVLRAGAAYCPIDANLPADRIRHLVTECSARALLHQSARPPVGDLVGRLPALAVDRIPAAVEALAPPDGGADDLAYVIYTSGSTGRPKGVMIEHRAAWNTIADINERIGLKAADRVFGISSLSFDLSVWDVFGTLAAGATLVLPDPTPRPDPLGWAALAAQAGATVWNSVPALAEMLVEVAEQVPGQQRAPIRAFLLSGDWIPTSLPDRMWRLWPWVRLTALGGATEAAIWSNSYPVDRVDPTWRSIPYGRPLRNQTMRILDHRMDVRPPWATGRIYIGGVGVARGYWRDEVRTAERFVRDPRTGERLYRTGDLGRYWPDGTIEFLGREDRQVKIQGFRVEPGEIESAVRDCPGVRECVVAAETGPGGQQRLICLVVPGEGTTPEPASIAARLRGALPHYMVPGQIHVVPRLPLTPNGKVDIARALALAAPDPNPTAGGAAGGAEPARDGRSAGDADGGHGSGGAPDPAQDLITGPMSELWRELLQVPAVDPDADFFALGGNSLLALRMINQIRSRLGVDLPFGQVFEAPTLRALSRAVAAGGPGASTTAGGGLAPVALAGARQEGPELFLFHPVGGSVTSYLELGRAWPGPVWAFQSPALTDPSPQALAPDLPSMAAGYRQALRRATPEGPYLLGGWSMGGVLAYEVARQLVEEGQRVSIFMIDSDIQERRRPIGAAAGHVEFLADLAGGRLPTAVAEAVLAAPEPEVAGVARDAAVRHGLLPAEVDGAAYQRLVGVHAHNLEILAKYQARPSDVPALLFVAGSTPRPDPVPAWRALCPTLEVEVWPEDHYSIVTPDGLRAIAERVRAWLARHSTTSDGPLGTR